MIAFGGGESANPRALLLTTRVRWPGIEFDRQVLSKYGLLVVVSCGWGTRSWQSIGLMICKPWIEHIGLAISGKQSMYIAYRLVTRNVLTLNGTGSPFLRHFGFFDIAGMVCAYDGWFVRPPTAHRMKITLDLPLRLKFSGWL
jgi:hypothetical protein